MRSTFILTGGKQKASQPKSGGRLEPARHSGGFAPKWAFCFAK